MQEFEEDASDVGEMDDLDGDRLGDPEMEEVGSIGLDQHEVEDEDGQIQLKAGGVPREEVEKSVRASKELTEIRAI